MYNLRVSSVPRPGNMNGIIKNGVCIRRISEVTEANRGDLSRLMDLYLKQEPGVAAILNGQTVSDGFRNTLVNAANQGFSLDGIDVATGRMIGLFIANLIEGERDVKYEMLAEKSFTDAERAVAVYWTKLRKIMEKHVQRPYMVINDIVLEEDYVGRGIARLWSDELAKLCKEQNVKHIITENCSISGYNACKGIGYRQVDVVQWSQVLPPEVSIDSTLPPIRISVFDIQ